MSKRHAHVVHTNEVEATEMAKGGFGARSRRLGARAGGLALGCSHVEVAPGKTAFPYHWHSGLEEALYILEGRGTLRIGAETVEIAAGDYVAFPAGPATAHDLTNTGDAPLRYLALSAPPTPLGMDVIGYPDSRKVAFLSGVKPGGSAWRDGAWAFQLIKQDQPKVEYFEDEPRAKD